MSLVKAHSLSCFHRVVRLQEGGLLIVILLLGLLLTVFGGAAQQIVATDVISALFDDQTTDATLYANEVRIRLTTQRTTPHNRTVSAAATMRVQLKN